MKKLIISIVLVVVFFAFFIARNEYFHWCLEKNYKSINARKTPPFGFEEVNDENGSHYGYHIWMLGPYEYRDKNSGEWKWTE